MCLKRENWLFFFVPFLAQLRPFLEPLLKATPSIPYWITKNNNNNNNNKKNSDRTCTWQMLPGILICLKRSFPVQGDGILMQNGKRPAGLSLCGQPKLMTFPTMILSGISAFLNDLSCVLGDRIILLFILVGYHYRISCWRLSKKRDGTSSCTSKNLALFNLLIGTVSSRRR